MEESMVVEWWSRGNKSSSSTPPKNKTSMNNGSHHYLHYLHHSLVLGQTTVREHSSAHQQKIGLKSYWAWPRPSEQDPVSPTVNVAQTVKHLPAMWATQVRSLGGEGPWRRKWQPTPGFLSGESHGQRSMVGHSPWGRKELDMTKWLHFLSMSPIRKLP